MLTPTEIAPVKPKYQMRSVLTTSLRWCRNIHPHIHHARVVHFFHLVLVRIAPSNCKWPKDYC